MFEAVLTITRSTDVIIKLTPSTMANLSMGTCDSPTIFGGVQYCDNAGNMYFLQSLPWASNKTGWDAIQKNPSDPRPYAVAGFQSLQNNTYGFDHTDVMYASSLHQQSWGLWATPDIDAWTSELDNMATMEDRTLAARDVLQFTLPICEIDGALYSNDSAWQAVYLMQNYCGGGKSSIHNVSITVFTILEVWTDTLQYKDADLQHCIITGLMNCFCPSVKVGSSPWPFSYTYKNLDGGASKGNKMCAFMHGYPPADNSTGELVGTFLTDP